MDYQHQLSIDLDTNNTPHSFLDYRGGRQCCVDYWTTDCGDTLSHLDFHSRSTHVGILGNR
jgi:hypothetical protein